MHEAVQYAMWLPLAAGAKHIGWNSVAYLFLTWFILGELALIYMKLKLRFIKWYPRDCSHNRRGCALERGARAGRELVLEVLDAVRDRGHRRHGGRAALRTEEVHARRAGFSLPAGVPRRVESGEVGGGGGEEGEVGLCSGGVGWIA